MDAATKLDEARSSTPGSGPIPAIEPDGRIPPATFCWLIGTLARIHRLPFDADLLVQQFPPPCDRAVLVEAIRALGLEARVESCSVSSLHPGDLPCVVAPSGGRPSWAIILELEGGQVRWITPESEVVRSDPVETFGTDACEVIAVFRAESVAGDEVAPEARRFGLKWLLPELMKHRRIWRELIVASLVIQLLGLAMPLFTQVVIDKVILHQATHTLVVIAAGFLSFVLFSGLMNWVRQYLLLHTGNRIDAVLGHRVLSHLFNLPPRYFERRPTGTLVARIQGVETIREFICGAALALVLDLPFLLIFLLVMLYYSWQLTVIVIAGITAIAAISVVVTPVLRSRLNEQFLRGARNQAFVTEQVSGLETVKALQMEPQVKRRYGDLLAEYLAATFSSRKLANTYGVTAQTIEQLQTVAVLSFGAWLVMTTDQLTIGMLVAFQMFASRMSQPLLRIVGLWQEFQQASIAIRRLGDIMDAPPEPYSIIPRRSATGPAAIELQGLGFRHGDDLPWLYRGFDLTLAPGSTAAIVGPSGSGKSTLGRLLLAFLPATEGRILIGGIDIRQMSANELRRQFGVVPQETVLFSGTIYENLVAANPSASFEQIVQACRMAGIHEAIEQLPSGFQTTVGEHGAGLSGGQKQRIAIARALLKRPGILLFDEATSSLDPATAEHFARTVNALHGKVTILFIAHHLPRGLRVDQVVDIGRAGEGAAMPESAVRKLRREPGQALDSAGGLT